MRGKASKFWGIMLRTLGPDERDRTAGVARKGKTNQLTCGSGDSVPTHSLLIPASGDSCDGSLPHSSFTGFG